MPSGNLPQPPFTSDLTGLTRSILVSLSRGKESFSNPPFPHLRSLTPLTFQFHLAWTHSRVRRTFPDASTFPGVTSPPPPDALWAFNLPQFAHAKRSCDLYLPVLAQGEEDFKSLSRLRSLKASRSFKSLSRLRSLKARRSLNLFLAYARSRRGGLLNLFLVERKFDTCASDRREAVRT